MFYKRFEERFALEKDADGSGAQLPGPEAVRQLHADQRTVGKYLLRLRRSVLHLRRSRPPAHHPSNWWPPMEKDDDDLCAAARGWPARTATSRSTWGVPAPAERRPARRLQNPPGRQFPLHGPGPLTLGTLNWALLPEGAYTGPRLAAWVSSNFAAATYSETTNSLSVAYDGNRLILNDLELRQQFPDAADYPAAPPASPTKPFSVDHMLGPSFGQQNEVYLRCATTSSPRSRKSGVGTIVETGSDDGHFMALKGPVTLRHMRFPA